MNNVNWHIAVLIVCLAGIISTAERTAQAADFFGSAATNLEFQRDWHAVSIGGYMTENAGVSNGQKTAIYYGQIDAISNIWNNEHNQVVAGVETEMRGLDQPLALPAGFIFPERFYTVSAGLLYRHITSGDWILTQAVQYFHSGTADPSVAVKDTVDLTGLVGFSPKPGHAFVFGYLFDQSSDIKNHFYPVIEYVNGMLEKWQFLLGYPSISVSYSPHPDWVMNMASIAYRVTDQSIIHASYGNDEWAYRLRGPGVTPVSYTAQQGDIGWSYVYHIDHHTLVSLSADFAYQFDRRIGATPKLTMDDAKTLRVRAVLSF